MFHEQMGHPQDKRAIFLTLFCSQANLSCEKTIHTFGTDGVLFTRTNFVTLKYRTDSWGTDMHGFKLIITAFKVSCN